MLTRNREDRLYASSVLTVEDPGAGMIMQMKRKVVWVQVKRWWLGEHLLYYHNNGRTKMLAQSPVALEY